MALNPFSEVQVLNTDFGTLADGIIESANLNLPTESSLILKGVLTMGLPTVNCGIRFFLALSGLTIEQRGVVRTDKKNQVEIEMPEGFYRFGQNPGSTARLQALAVGGDIQNCFAQIYYLARPEISYA